MNRWHDETDDAPPMLCQDARPRSSWPYAQDWIVDCLKYDHKRRSFWVSGKFSYSEETFFWELYADRPLCWRYDLTNARYVTGAHWPEPRN